MIETQPPPAVDGIIAASTRIERVFADTPLIEQASANAAMGCRLLAKVETLNPIRSFKGRGADWLMANLHGDAPVVCASAGNFGQGLAYAARSRGRPAIVFAATTANPLKIDAMKRLGADVRLAGDDFDAAKAAARSFAEASGLEYVEDGARAAIAEGAGTIALEMTQTLEARGIALDAVVVPLGNGALLTAVGTWIKARAPACRVIGVVAAGAPAMRMSWQSGRVLPTASAATIADGIAVREPVAYALECMKTTVDDVWAVEEASLVSAIRFCHRHYGLVVEPAGGAGVAALLEYPDRLAGRTVGTILCGGNLAPGVVSFDA